ITAAAKEQCEVIILSEKVSQTESYLLFNNQGGPGFDNLDNVTILDVEFNSIWMRDYAANTVYGSGVDDLILVDWIYNRPRPDDDVSPAAIADYLGIDLYCTTAAPTDLVNTGGNFMSDGFGSGFASELILEENEPGNDYEVTAKDEEEIDLIMNEWMGLDRYIKMTSLPNDLIHHIDMHMKLLDEERLIVSEYPEGVSDGPQIQANMEYVLSNYNSLFGTAYKINWIPAPPDNGQYPILGQNFASYKTYTNATFVNKTILLPTYEEPYDSEAIAMWEELMPGYNVVGIDCDDPGRDIIALSGAIHCITHTVGVEDPLLISHQALPDTDDQDNNYIVDALIRHRSGISGATLYWKTDLNADYQSVAMSFDSDDHWLGEIPAQTMGTTVYYYVQGNANSGKTQVRPIVAPEGYWEFDVDGIISVE
ncbi:MAG: agmatine deiminase family protein, partial [Bacteroidota bacterium]